MRKTQRVTIDAGTAETNRDFGKEFLITEMSAAAAEAWGLRAMSAIARSGVEMPADIAESGIVGAVYFGMEKIVSAKFEDAKPLLDEMMACVKKIEEHAPDGRALMDGDIEEVGTRIWLRDEVFELHTGFSGRALALSATTQLIAALTKPNGSSPQTPPDAFTPEHEALTPA